MTEIDWKPGDVAWIECTIGPGLHWRRRDDGWESADHIHGPNRVAKTPQPVLILRADDDAGIEALAEAYSDTMRAIGDIKDSMRAAVETVIAAQHPPKPPAEPLNLDARVIDKDDREWARIGGAWVSSDWSSRSWQELMKTFGPLEIIPPGGGER